MGVVLLFFYVLPRRQRTGGTIMQWTTTNIDQRAVAIERGWDHISAVGLWAVIIGIALQAVGVWLAP